jgi:hypothetical protein
VNEKRDAEMRTAEDLTAALTGMSERLDGVRRDAEERAEQVRVASEERDAYLKTYGRRNRRLIWLTVVSLVADLTLTVFLAVFAVQVHHAAASNRNLCLSNNAARAQNLQLWSHLIGISQAAPARPGETAAQRAAAQKELAGLKLYVSHVFAARDCSNIGPGNP